MAEADKNRETGVRVFKAARIRFRNERLPIDCVVRYLTPTGAQLYVENAAAIPEFFYLVTSPTSVPRHCRIVAIDNRQIEVRFQEA